jgi:hypothetical protein
LLQNPGTENGLFLKDRHRSPVEKYHPIVGNNGSRHCILWPLGTIRNCHFFNQTPQLKAFLQTFELIQRFFVPKNIVTSIQLNSTYSVFAYNLTK